jgi:hypothetical protein
VLARGVAVEPLQLAELWVNDSDGCKRLLRRQRRVANASVRRRSSHRGVRKLRLPCGKLLSEHARLLLPGGEAVGGSLQLALPAHLGSTTRLLSLLHTLLVQRLLCSTLACFLFFDLLELGCHDP